VTQFEAEQLSILAGAWRIMSEAKGEDEARGIRRCSDELREWLQHANTAPADAPEGEPDRLPPMRAPRLPTFTSEDT